VWHVVFAEPGQLPKSRAARSRDAAIHAACELLAAGCDVRRVIEPHGSSIERTELDAHYDEGRFPGLRLMHIQKLPGPAITLRPYSAGGNNLGRQAPTELAKRSRSDRESGVFAGLFASGTYVV